ncbi:chemotaxis protein CheB [Mastigocoleus testarum]|uniref:Circadian input-output histidine kinase CikA n=1 Tax=Mastigocoleus testarum BC008 TaxID=371196 RepID=A0A0V7ZGR7_9CYAN|nr:chemotaxis protein CheB [Mastigocoleus testarum]KST63623.1 hypothetical protein BC008_14270 [Mastigocoleus testarum BC008]
MQSSESGEQQNNSSQTKDFFVVGIGASAGGLRPIEEFFEHIPTDSGAAFVIVQHLSPDFKSLMKELLGRKTKMEIYRVEDGMRLKPNSIYLIPPGKNLVIENKYLRLQKQNRNNQRPNFSIDIFFKSLAQDCPERAIALVLSGTGSDGTHGVRAIHEAGGLAMAQDPQTAEFDGMPTSAIATGVIEQVLSPPELAEIIYKCLKSPSTTTECISSDSEFGLNSEKIQRISNILARHDQVDFSHYKPSTLCRRIHRRCLIVGCKNLEDYIDLLEVFPEERESLRNDLLISVTSFFRDFSAWEYLKINVIPNLLETIKAGEELRVWVSACATGEEAYSLGILLDEAIDNLGKSVKVKIFATDIDKLALEKAANGIYPETIANDISPERLEKYFIHKDQCFQVTRKLREMLIFAPHDLAKDAGFTRIHLITCRNVLIYMQTQLQQQVLRNLHFSLSLQGILFLGEAETVGEYQHEFSTVHEKWKIYQKRRDVRLPLPVRGIEKISRNFKTQQSAFPLNNSRKEQMLELAFTGFLAENKTTCLLVDRDYQVLHIFEDLLGVLKLPTGNPTMDITKLVLPSLQLPLNTALHRAKREKGPVSYIGINLCKDDCEQSVNLKVSYYQGKKLAGDLLMVVMSAQTPSQSIPVGDRFEADSESQERIIQLEHELQQTRENLQATIEELETSNEEQQATNEELIASNEELQSTNEELHSVNEELFSVNTEHQSKIQELTELNSDVHNLLGSTNIGVVFLDQDLKIRKFTRAATQAINLVGTDIGRPLAHLSYNFHCSDLMELLKQVIATQEPQEREVKINSSGINLLMRINPYQQENELADGVVITFVDINEIKKVQQKLSDANDALQEREQQLGAILSNTKSIIYLKDIQGRYILGNKYLFEVIDLSEEEVIGKTDGELFPPQFADVFYANDQEVLDKGKALEFEEQLLIKDKLHTYISVKAPLKDPDSGIAYAICGISTDISHIKQIEAELRQANTQLAKAKEGAEAANKAKSEFLAKMTHELRTPLNAILGFTQILHRQDNFNKQQHKYLDTVLRSGKHLLDLINDILDISKIEAGMSELRISGFDLYGMIDSLEQMLHNRASSKGLQFNIRIDRDVPQYINADEAKLRQILINLLGNAIKFTKSGSVNLHIKIAENLLLRSEEIKSEEIKLEEIKLQKSTINFEVEDTGKGIPPEELNRVFEAFVQSGTSYQTFEGTGLGLAISKRFVELMGGEIHIQSTLGRGTKVDFDLTVTSIPKEEFTQSLPKGRIVGLAPDQPKPLILVVEDNWENRQLLFQILSDVGFLVITASDGKEAVEKWEQHDPALILMDMRMPVMDGYQATKYIKSSDKGKNTTIIIAQTASAFNEERKFMLSLGCNDFIHKPFQEQVILEKIGIHLGINFIYQSDLNRSASPENTSVPLTSDSLTVMSKEWRNKLNQFASTCNQNAVMQTLSEIPETHNPLKQRLFKLAYDFQFDTIVGLTKIPTSENVSK